MFSFCSRRRDRVCRCCGWGWSRAVNVEDGDGPLLGKGNEEELPASVRKSKEDRKGSWANLSEGGASLTASGFSGVQSLRSREGHKFHKACEMLEEVLAMSWWKGVHGEARQTLQDVLAILEEHDVEAEEEPPQPELGSVQTTSRMSLHGRQSAVGRRNSPLFSLMNDSASSDSSPRSGEAMTKTLTESRKWLLQNYTTADFSAAEGHEASCRRRKFMPDISDLEESDEEQEPSGPRVGPLKSHRRNTRDETASLGLILRQPQFAEMFKKAGTLEFDALEFAGLSSVNARPLQCLGAWAASTFLVKDLTSKGNVAEAAGAKFQACLTRFLGEIDTLYNADTPYHNSAHAADVVMTMEWFLRSEYMKAQVSTLDHLMVFVAAAIHDVAHPGRNNMFHTKTMSALAVAYNDKSVLENMHIAKSFELMQSDKRLNWFAMLQQTFLQRDKDGKELSGAPVNLQQYVRRGLIDMVLATDNAKHPEHVNKIMCILEANDEPALYGLQALKMEALEKKLHLLECVLHAADISNPCKIHPMMLRWTEKVLAEFWAQGDEERSLGVDISPMCDRVSGQRTIPKGQLGFITFVLMPFYSPLAELIPEVAETTKQLAETRAFWEKMDKQQATPEVIFASIRDPPKFAAAAR